MAILNKACVVCGELETASKIIAIFQLIGALIMSLANIIVIYTIFVAADYLHTSLGQLEDARDNFQSDFQGKMNAEHEAAMGAADMFMKFAKAYIVAFQVVFIVIELIFVAQVVACSALIHGIKKERRGLALMYLAVQAFSCVFSLLLVILVAATPFAGNAVSFFLSNIVSMALGVYCWVVVYSYYQMMGERTVRGDMMMK